VDLSTQRMQPSILHSFQQKDVLNYMISESCQVFWDTFLAPTVTAMNFKIPFNHKEWPTI